MDCCYGGGEGGGFVGEGIGSVSREWGMEDGEGGHVKGVDAKTHMVYNLSRGCA